MNQYIPVQSGVLSMLSDAPVDYALVTFVWVTVVGV